MRKWVIVLSCGWILWHGTPGWNTRDRVNDQAPYWGAADGLAGFESGDECARAMNARVDKEILDGRGNLKDHVRRDASLTRPPQERQVAVQLLDRGRWVFWYQYQCFPVGHNPNGRPTGTR